ncbi:MAG: hypothetical protein EA369_09730 [Bradymonadales bacterium]|nr:MAG: hypothetical protein EA369_09730 [Bradymonadales bacterium]
MISGRSAERAENHTLDRQIGGFNSSYLDKLKLKAQHSSIASRIIYWPAEEPSPRARRLHGLDERVPLRAGDLDPEEALEMTNVFQEALQLRGEAPNSISLEFSDSIEIGRLQNAIKVYRVDTSLGMDRWQLKRMFLKGSSLGWELENWQLYRIHRGKGSRSHYVSVLGGSSFGRFFSGWYVLYISGGLESDSGSVLTEPLWMAFRVSG